MDLIIPNIYVGNAVDAYDEEKVIDSGVDAIICVALEYHPEEIYSFEVVRCGLHDEHENMPENTDSQLLKPINELKRLIDSGKTVLVHCSAGRNRSVAVIVGYLVLSGKFKAVAEAYNYVCSKHTESSMTKKLKQHLEKLFEK